MAYQSFEDLEVWKRSCAPAIRVLEAMKDGRNFGLKDQMERSAVSVPSNIAEGQERDYRQDFVRFLRIAKGSSGELKTQLYLARDLGLVADEPASEMLSESKQISSMLQGLIRSLG